jgi:hypothetical protein
MRSVLDGITRESDLAPVENPTVHSPVAVQNRIKLRVVGPDGKIKQEVNKVENILNDHGLNRLVDMIAGSSNASDWVRNYKIGTDNTAASSDDAGLGASTASVAVSNTNIVDAGNRTIRYVVTFASDNPASTAQIHEVGLFQSTQTNLMIARSVLGGDSVNKGQSDQIQISHDVVFNTSA